MAHDEPKTKPHPVRDDVLREHQKLMPIVHDLAAAADTSPGDATAWSHDVKGRLLSLRRNLLEHFREEETGSFGTTFPQTFPHLAGRASELLAQHPAILRSVDAALVAAGRVPADDAGAAHELKASLHQLLATIRRHEAAENELVLDAVWDDFGGGD